MSYYDPRPDRDMEILAGILVTVPIILFIIWALIQVR